MRNPAGRGLAIRLGGSWLAPLAAIACTAVASWLALREADLDAVRSGIAGLRVWPFFVSFGALLAATFLRGLRLHLLMRRVQSSLRVSLETVVIGYLFTTLLPFRAGEVVRVGWFARRSGAPVLATASGMVVERVMDLAAVGLIAALLASSYAAQLSVSPLALGLGGAAALAVALAAGIAVRSRQPNLQSRAGRLIHDAVHGLAALGSPADVALVALVSLVLWAIVTASMKVAFLSAGVDLPLSGAALVMLGTTLALALPAAPGYVGTYHLGFAGAALLAGVPREVSLPVAVVFHLVIQVPFLPIGGLVLLLAGRGRGREEG